MEQEDRLYIPIKGWKVNKYTEWFDNIGKELSKTFIDVTPERIIKCCNDSPCDEVAQIIYDATSLEIQVEFYHSLRDDTSLLEKKEDDCHIINLADDDSDESDGTTPYSDDEDHHGNGYWLPPPSDGYWHPPPGSAYGNAYAPLAPLKTFDNDSLPPLEKIQSDDDGDSLPDLI